MLQDEALHLLKMGKNIFLTGAAGAGKTFLLNKYIQYLKDHNVSVAITASTGIAATHLQGQTLHAWSGIGIKENLSEADLKNLFTNKRIKANYKKTKVLIIDEISMLHKHHLDMLDTIARSLLNKDQAFGNLQIVLCGDFFQLPPVTTSSTSINMEDKPFAFYAKSWEEGNFQVCYLHEQHRQNNDPLLEILNDIRSGKAGEQTKVPLRTRYKKEPLGATKATRLYSRNMNVDRINAEELAKISSEQKIYTMRSSGFNALVENLKKSCLAPEALHLKIGAEVMFVKNDSFSNQYVNGTRGIVIGFEGNEAAWPIIKTYDNKTIIAMPEAWNYEDQGIIRASIIQIPLRLAWAITIHKSQGMTLDAAEMDLGDAFEPGMGYVALSRVRSLTGLKLMNLNEMALRVHPKVLEQDIVFKNNSTNCANFLQSLSTEEIEKIQNETLISRFDGSKTPIKPENRPHKKQKKMKKDQTPTHLITLQLIKENLCIESTANQRSLTQGTIITHIEKLKGLNLLENDFFIQLKETIKNKLKIEQKDLELIHNELHHSEDGKLKPIYEKFEGKYSYDVLQSIRLII